MELIWQGRGFFKELTGRTYRFKCRTHFGRGKVRVDGILAMADQLRGGQLAMASEEEVAQLCIEAVKSCGEMAYRYGGLPALVELLGVMRDWADKEIERNKRREEIGEV